MKNLQSTTEGTWVELKQVELTEEQKTLLQSKKESDKEAIKALFAEIKALREVEAQEEDAVLAQAKYEAIKLSLKLKETDVYQLISFNISNNTGILNYRINGEHKQIRF
jgi:hypothetical protein